MQRVRLLGELGELFGEEHSYHNLRHTGDAIKMLCINQPAFKEYLLASEQNGIVFQVIQSEVAIKEDELLLPLGQADLVIVPVISGSGFVADFFQDVGALVSGAVLFVASVVLPFAAPVLLPLAVGLTLKGVSDIISPQPEIPQFGGLNAAGGSRFGSRNSTSGAVGVERALGGQQSYAYTGAANTVGVGATVPVAYGKVLIGSHLLRSKIEVTDESDPIQKAIKQPGVDTVLIGGEKPSYSYGAITGAEVKLLADNNKTTYKSLNGGSTFVTNSGSTIGLYQDGVTGVVTVAKKTFKKNKENFNVILRLPGGLYEYPGSSVAGIYPTKADAYISYEVKVCRGTEIKDTRLIAMDTATIQGLLVGQKVTWMHKMQIPTAQDEANVSVQVKIIDTTGLPYDSFNGNSQTLSLMAIGYNLI